MSEKRHKVILPIAILFLGIAGTVGRGRKLLPGLLFGFVILVHIITMANARHRMPWMPLLIVYASFSVVHFRTLAWRSDRRGLVVPLIVLLVFFGLCVPQIGAIASELWSSSASDLPPW